MKTLLRQDIPEDFVYYRTGSQVFYEYYKKYTHTKTIRVTDGYEFLHGFQVLPGWWSITAEKIDKEPNIELLKKEGIPHGIIWWIPFRRHQKPTGWRKCPPILPFFDIHSSRSAFVILEKEYWKKWTASTRAHRRKILKFQEQGTVEIRSANISEFLTAYDSAKIRDPNKDFVRRMTGKLFGETTTSYRVYLAYVDGDILAGAVFIDQGTTSEYWGSFYTEASRPYHLGVALMDRWMADSYQIGIKYCDLDHMWDRGSPRSQKGYTTFKENFADYDVYFRDMWVRIF